MKEQTKSMTCLRDHEHGADLLIGYLENTLAPEQRLAIDEHARGCAECRGLLAVQATLDEFTAPEVSPDFDDRLFARITEDEARSSRWVRLGSHVGRYLWTPAIPLAAAAAIVVGVLWMRPAAESADDTLKQAGVISPSDIDPQQLQQLFDDLELLMPVTTESEAEI